MSTPLLRSRTRLGVAALLAGWVGILIVTLLGPSAEGPSWLVETVTEAATRVHIPPALAAPERIEFILNAVAFAPVSLLGGLLWPRLTWRDWTAGGFVASFLVEAVQAVFLEARSATYVDVVSNTLGALGGSLVALGLARTLLGGRSEDRADLPDRSSPTQQDQLPG